MAKKMKIKRYHDGGSFYKAKPHPVVILLTILAVGGLVFLGVSIYEPVADFFQQLANPTEPQLNLPEETQAPIEESTEPAPDPVAVYPETRAVYLPTSVLADDARLDATLESLKGADVNTVMIDIKDTDGNVLFNSKNALAAEWGAKVETPLDLAAFAERLAQEKIMLAVRITVFQDPIAANGNRENAIRYLDTEWLWLDNTAEAGGRPWLNPYSEGAKQYITELCLEAADAGARLVVLDSFQFPVGSVNNANFGSRAGVVSRSDILKGYVDELSAKLMEKEARAAVYLTALSLTQEAENESRYGGSPLYFAGDSIVLGALPYQFYDGFTYGEASASQPARQPGTATGLALSIFLDEHPFAGDPPGCVPMLQGGSEPGINEVVYTAEEVTAQIDAVKARGIQEYILYATDGNYVLE